MLTPDKIKNKEFHTTGKGSYRSEEVDDFMKEVHASYEKVFRENGEIIKKMSILANKVEEYKKDEDSLRQALLSAQKLADQITSEAKANAEKKLADAEANAESILNEAKQKAESLTAQAKTAADEKLHDANKEANEILGGINRKVTQEKLVLEMLQKEVGAFKNKMMDMYKEHLTLLDRLPSLASEQLEEKAPAEEAPAEEIPAAEEPVQAEENDLEEVVPEAEEISDEYLKEGFVLDEQADEEPLLDEEIHEVEDGIPELDGGEEDEEPEIMTYSPEAVKEEDDDFFTLDESALDDDEEDTADEAEEAFEDISSGVDEDDGFSLNFDEIDDLDDDDGEEVIEPKPAEYASADEEATDKEAADDDDDDEGAISFKRFFKKK